VEHEVERGIAQRAVHPPEEVAEKPGEPTQRVRAGFLEGGPVDRRQESGADELRGLAGLLGDFLRRMNRVLGDPPFNFMLHTAPLRDSELESFHWHLEVIPKLTSVAGFEWGSGFFINPMPPEDAAEALRADQS